MARFFFALRLTPGYRRFKALFYPRVEECFTLVIYKCIFMISVLFLFIFILSLVNLTTSLKSFI